MDKVKNLYYDGASVTAQEMPFTWKVWQAASGTDNFLWVSILANTAIVKGCLWVTSFAAYLVST